MLAVLAVLLAAEAVARVLAPYLPDPLIWITPEAQHKAAQIHARGTADVVLLGSSLMDAGGDSAAIARDSQNGGRLPLVYNAALSGITLGAVAQWAEAVAQPGLRPRVAVLGLGFADLNANVPGRVSGEARFADSAGMREAMGRETLALRLERLAGDVSELFRLRGLLMRPIASLRQGRREWEPGLGGLLDPRLTGQGMSVTFIHDPYGMFDGRPIAPAARRAQLLGGILHDFAVTPELDARLRALIRALQAKSVSVVLAEMPFTQDVVPLLPHRAADVGALTSVIQSAAAATGVSFVRGGVWPTALFADPVHLNGAGAARLARLLGPVVARALGTAR